MNIVDVGILVAGIVVVCQAVKTAGLQSKYVPLFAIVLGIGGSFLLEGVSWIATASGVLVGLATTLGFREIKRATE